MTTASHYQHRRPSSTLESVKALARDPTSLPYLKEQPGSPPYSSARIRQGHASPRGPTNQNHTYSTANASIDNNKSWSSNGKVVTSSSENSLTTTIHSSSGVASGSGSGNGTLRRSSETLNAKDLSPRTSPSRSTIRLPSTSPSRSPIASTERRSSSSKPTLTMALQRAQSAVLLDTANDVPAAIEAYVDSVHLLIQVMETVREGCSRDREVAMRLGAELLKGKGKLREPDEAADDPESRERQRRAGKAEKKWKAKLEEGRRLKVIHDTYVDRIRMLSSMTGRTDDPFTPVATSFPLPPPTRAYSSRDIPFVSSPPATDPPSIPLPTPLSSSRLGDSFLPSLPSTAIDPSFAVLSGPRVSTTPASERMDRRTSDDGIAKESRMIHGYTSARLATSLASPSPSISPYRRESISSSSAKFKEAEMPSPLDPFFPTSITAATVNRRISNSSSATSPKSITSPLPRSSPRYELSGKDGMTSNRDGTRRRDSEIRSSDASTMSKRAQVEWEALGGPVSKRRSEDSENGDTTESSMGTGSIENRLSIATTASSRFRSGSSASSIQRTVSNTSLSSSSRSNSILYSNTTSSTATPVPSPHRAARSHRSSSSASNSNGTKSAFPPMSPVTASIETEVKGHHRRPSHLAIQQNLLPVEDEAESFLSAELGTISSTVGEAREKVDQMGLRSEESRKVSGEYARRRPALAISTDITSSNLSSARIVTTDRPAPYSTASLPARLRTVSSPANVKRPSFSSHVSEQPLPTLPPTVNLSRSISRPDVSTTTDWNHPPSETSSLAPPLSRRPSSSGSSFRSAPRSALLTSTYDFSPPPPPSLSSFDSTTVLSPLRRPFQLMRALHTSIDQGGYISTRLYVPRAMWEQAGVKLVAMETKVRMLDLLGTGLEGIEKAGETLLSLSSVPSSSSIHSRRDGEEGANARKGHALLARELAGFEGLMEAVSSTLEKKLGYASAPSKSSGTLSGKKPTPTSFSAWSSKLSRSLDRVTTSRSLDSPATYVESISKLFKQADIIDQHLDQLLSPSPLSPYSLLSSSEIERLEHRWKRISEFFGQVICRFVLRDVGMLLDKYVKRGGVWVGND